MLVCVWVCLSVCVCVCGLHIGGAVKMDEVVKVLALCGEAV